MSRLSWLGKSQHKKMQHEVSTQLFCQLFLYCRYQILSIYFDLDSAQKLRPPCLVFGLGCIGYQSSHAIIRARRSKPKQNETSKLFVWKWKNEYCTLKNIQTTISEIICFAKDRKKEERKKDICEKFKGLLFFEKFSLTYKCWNWFWEKCFRFSC
jgi:hypothetical protein